MRRIVLILAVIGATLLATSGAALAQVETKTIVPYLDTGYKYKVVPWGGGAGFEGLNFDDSSFSTGDAAFGTYPGVGCPLENTIKTQWPVNTDILVRKSFELPPNTTNLKVHVAIDNDVQVFLNGQDISGGMQKSEFCAVKDRYVFTVPDNVLQGGTNVLAVRGHDYGVVAYLDVKVTADVDDTPPAAPTLDLDAGSDSGKLDNDDITKVNTPKFTGKAEAGSTVEIFDGSTSLGTATADIGDADANGNKGWSFTVPSDRALSDGNHSITAKATDGAGNTSNPPDPTLSVLIDTATPSVTFNGDISDNQSFYYGDVPSEPTCTADDGNGGSGVDGGCTVSGYSTAVGNHTLTARAKDIAGNEDPKYLSYSVLAWTLKGFYKPVDMNNTLNTVKAGSTVPLKFEVFKGSTELTDTSIIKTFTQKTDCVSGTTEDPIEDYATGDTSLRYDTFDGQFVFNWKTPNDPGSCYKVTMTTQDGSSLSANFGLK